MDLIYTNAARTDQGVLLDFDLDLAFGFSENNFECRIVQDAHCCEPGSLLYFDGTEYGGIIDSIESDTSTKEVVYSGRTWHGIINSKVLEPDSGQSHLKLTGEANSVIRTLITRLNLSALFEGDTSASGLTFNNYQVPRYISAYEGLLKALATIGGKLVVSYNGNKVKLSARPRVDYSSDEEFDTSVVPLKSKKNYTGVNHLICLGSGELENRLVVHLYADTNGNISQTQTQTGLAEITQIFELSSASSSSELVSEGTSKFKELMNTGSIEVDLTSEDDIFDVLDIIGTYDNITGVSVSEQITKKIIKITDGILFADYETDTTMGSSFSGGSGETAEAFLPLSGGTLSGKLSIASNGECLVVGQKNTASDANVGAAIGSSGRIYTRLSNDSSHIAMFPPTGNYYVGIKPEQTLTANTAAIVPNKNGKILVNDSGLLPVIGNVSGVDVDSATIESTYGVAMSAATGSNGRMGAVHLRGYNKDDTFIMFSRYTNNNGVYTKLIPTLGANTNGSIITLPDKTGTVALTDELPTFVDISSLITWNDVNPYNPCQAWCEIINGKKKVTIVYTSANTDHSTGASNPLFIVPSDYKPPKTIYFPFSGSTRNGLLGGDANGKFYIVTITSSTASDKYISSVITYFI